MTGGPNARYEAFLLVGIAYFIVAILGPAIILLANHGSVAFWKFPKAGVQWSFLAGVVGAAGAFFVLLALGAGGKPPQVMSVVFAGAPIINALVSLSLDKRADWASIPWQFYLGIALAATGGGLVTIFKPTSPPPKISQAEAPAK